MLVGGRLCQCLIFIWCSSILINVPGDILNTKEKRNRRISPLLSYLPAYKIGENFAVQIPSFVLSPVLIVPVSFQQSNRTLSINFPNEGIDENFELQNKNCSLDGNNIDVNDTFRQVNVVATSSTENVTEKDEFTSNTDISKTNESENFTTTITNTEMMSGFYPVPAYDNEKINSLQFTAPIEATLELSSVDKERNVTSETNKTEIETSEIENIGNKLLESGSSRVVSFQLTTEKYNARPNTRYYNPHSFWVNAMGDQSLTTNSYKEEEKESPLPPRQDDRWRRFSSLSKVILPPSGFKPLAGLYYDGFLNKYLTKKTGFIPFHKYYYD